jgi:hypothetical protein
MSLIKGPQIMSTADTNFSSYSHIWQCSGNNAGDIIATTSVGLGHVTSGLVVVFQQSSAGTIAAGLTSGNEYLVVNVDAGTSSFQVYGFGGSSAVEITADSTGGYDYAYVVGGSGVLPVAEYKNVVLEVIPTSGYSGRLTFIGSMNDDLDSNGRKTSGNNFYQLAYRDLTASSYPALGTTYITLTGGTSGASHMYSIDCEGMGNLAVRTAYTSAGGVVINSNMYKE